MDRGRARLAGPQVLQPAVPRPTNVFAGPYLDRIAHLRKDAEFVRSAAAGESARIVVVHDSRLLLRRTDAGWSPVFLAASHAAQLALQPDDLVMLGRSEDQFYFAAEVTDPGPAQALADAGPVRFEDLRVAGGILPAGEAGVLAYARAMLYWRSRHRFCGACGAPTRSASAGHVLKCTNSHVFELVLQFDFFRN